MTIRIPIEKAISQAEGEGADSLLDGFTQLEHVLHMRLPTIMLENGDGVVGEGVSVSNADEWHKAGFRGQGVKVGVIDLGFMGYEELLGNGLPANVHLAPNFKLGNGPHGTAVAEIVHEMAPDAELYFALGDDEVPLNNAAKWMADNGVQVINYSAGNSYGPFNGTSSSAKIVDQASARGILWVNAAGNSGQAHWSAPFHDQNGDGWHEFTSEGSEGGELLGVAGNFVALSWWEGNQEANYDLCLFNQSGEKMGCSVDTQGAGSRFAPVESWPVQINEAYYVAIKLNGNDSSASRLKLLVNDEIAPDFQVAEGSLTTPADASGALAVGAVVWQDDKLAPYSSQGPTADGRNKPELSAPTHVQSVSYPESPTGFNGTSAAAPHVAGAAALVLSAFPEMNRNEVADYLISHATDLGPNGYDLAYGEGRLDLGSPPSGEAPPAPPAPPAASAAFTDDFSDPKSGLPHQASDEGWSSTYENGMYVMTAEFFPSGDSWERYQGLDFDDFTLNVEAERLDGVPSDYYGVVFRAQDNDNYHLFQISDLGLARWQRLIEGDWESLVEAKLVTVNNNKANSITIEARGKRLTVFVNGKEFHTIDDDSIGHGTIGFMVTNYGLPFTAGFDNLSVTPTEGE